MADLIVSSAVDSFMGSADQSGMRTALALGTSSTQDDSYFATAAQGSLADSAVQPGDLSTVATTGAYTDLLGTPTLGSLAAKSSISNIDVASNAGIALSKLATDPLARANHTGTQAASTITGLSTVATTGAYADLSGKPTLGDLADNNTISNSDVAADAAIALSKLATDPLARANHTGTQAANTITGLSTVATTGAYADLSGTPTLGSLAAKSSIGNVDVASNAAIALSKLATDPLARANHTGTQDVSTITGLSTVATTGAYSDLSGKPSLGTLASLSSISVSNISATGTPSNTTFLRGDGVWASPAGGGGGDLLAANNLSDLANAATARTNLGLGTAATTAASAYATAVHTHTPSDIGYLNITLNATDSTYRYFGGVNGSGAWRVIRYQRSSLTTKSTASQSNNSGVTNLTDAWTNRATLTYA